VPIIPPPPDPNALIYEVSAAQADQVTVILYTASGNVVQLKPPITSTTITVSGVPDQAVTAIVLCKGSKLSFTINATKDPEVGPDGALFQTLTVPSRLYG
jgi:hypothetical protein